MKLSWEQFVRVQTYRRAARLHEDAYREVLKNCAGVHSSKSDRWTQEGYERVMAALESLLFERVRSGQIQNPIGRHKDIRDEYYWRNRVPGSGQINSRQAHRIEELWASLQRLLPEEDRTVGYFTAMASKATGRRDVGMVRLSSGDAWKIIEALKDRISNAVRADEEEVPF